MCNCRTGYSGDGFNNCSGNLPQGTLASAAMTDYVVDDVDIDECAMSVDMCNSTVSVCQNAPGSFDCICRDGFNMTDEECVGECCTCTITDTAMDVTNLFSHKPV